MYREQLRATPAAVPLIRHGVGDALTEAGVADPAPLADIALVVGEATTNAVIHAYPPGAAGHVEVIVTRTPDSIIVTVKDEGDGMDKTLRETRGLGLGLPLMNSQTERLEIRTDTTGTIVTLHFPAVACGHTSAHARCRGPTPKRPVPASAAPSVTVIETTSPTDHRRSGCGELPSCGEVQRVSR